MSLTPPAGPFNLGNTLYVNQEVAPDRVPLYSQLVDSYKWMEKVTITIMIMHFFIIYVLCLFAI